MWKYTFLSRTKGSFTKTDSMVGVKQALTPKTMWKTATKNEYYIDYILGPQ